MSKRLSKLQIVHRQNPQLQCVNEKIAALASAKPWSDVYAAFSLRARLATEGIEAATELQQMPGAAVRKIEPTLEFWYRVRDFKLCCCPRCRRWKPELGRSACDLPFAAKPVRGGAECRLRIRN
jgi:hypothetical protein